MSKKAQEEVSTPAVGTITSVEEAARKFGANFVAELAQLLAPQLQRLAQGNVRKVYEIEPYTGTHEVIEYVRKEMLDPEGEPVADDKGKKKYIFVEQKRRVSGGWMVYLPQGHSLYIETADQLATFKLDSPTGLVDMNTGLRFDEEVESIKSKVSRNTHHTPRSRRSGDGSLAGDIGSVINTLE